MEPLLQKTLIYLSVTTYNILVSNSKCSSVNPNLFLTNIVIDGTNIINLYFKTFISIMKNLIKKKNCVK